MNRIALFGGTFNPIHIGHLAMAQEVADKLRLSKVFFIPSYLPPHKSSKNVAPAKERMDMVRIAIRGNPRFTVSDYEVKRPRKSYSIYTAEHFQEKFGKNTEIYFIIGADSLKSLHKWKEIGRLIKVVRFVALNRPGSGRPRSKIKVKHLTMPGLDISSSEIRRRLKKGHSIRYLVPETVYRHISREGLFL